MDLDFDDVSGNEYDGVGYFCIEMAILGTAELAYYEHDQPGVARALVEHIQKLYPDYTNPDMEELEGNIQFYKEADLCGMSSLQENEPVDGELEDALLDLAEMAHQTFNDDKTAIMALKNALKINPANHYSRKRLAAFYWEQSETVLKLSEKEAALSLAIKEIETVLEAAPTDVEAMNALANYYMDMHDFQSAKFCRQRFNYVANEYKAMPPDNAAALYSLAFDAKISYALISDDEVEAGAKQQRSNYLTFAVQWLDEAERLSPEDAHIKNALAEALEKQGRFVEAIDVHGQLQFLNKESPWPEYNIGRLFRLKGDEEAAQVAFSYLQKAHDKALKVLEDPELMQRTEFDEGHMFEVEYELALALMNLNVEDVPALTLFEKLAEKDYDNPWPDFYSSKILRRNGEYCEGAALLLARDALWKALNGFCPEEKDTDLVLTEGVVSAPELAEIVIEAYEAEWGDFYPVSYENPVERVVRPEKEQYVISRLIEDYTFFPS